MSVTVPSFILCAMEHKIKEGILGKKLKNFFISRTRIEQAKSSHEQFITDVREDCCCSNLLGT